MRLLSFWFVIAASLVFGGVPLSAGATGKTAEHYRKAGVTVVHAVRTPPLYFRDTDGQIKGALVDYWLKWSMETGIPVEFRTASWAETLELVRNGECDLHAGLVALESRKEDFLFTGPITPIRAVILVEEGYESGWRGICDGDSAIGIVAKSHMVDVVRQRCPKARVVQYKMPSLVVDGLAGGEVRAVAMDIPTFHFNNAGRAEPIKYVEVDVLFEHMLHGGVQAGNKVLLDLVDEGMAKIVPKESRAIFERWYVTSPQPSARLNTWLWLGVAATIFVLALFIMFRHTRN